MYKYAKPPTFTPEHDQPLLNDQWGSIQKLPKLLNHLLITSGMPEARCLFNVRNPEMYSTIILLCPSDPQDTDGISVRNQKALSIKVEKYGFGDGVRIVITPLKPNSRRRDRGKWITSKSATFRDLYEKLIPVYEECVQAHINHQKAVEVAHHGEKVILSEKLPDGFRNHVINGQGGFYRQHITRGSKDGPEGRIDADISLLVDDTGRAQELGGKPLSIKTMTVLYTFPGSGVDYQTAMNHIHIIQTKEPTNETTD